MKMSSCPLAVLVLFVLTMNGCNQLPATDTPATGTPATGTPSTVDSPSPGSPVLSKAALGIWLKTRDLKLVTDGRSSGKLTISFEGWHEERRKSLETVARTLSDLRMEIQMPSVTVEGVLGDERLFIAKTGSEGIRFGDAGKLAFKGHYGDFKGVSEIIKKQEGMFKANKGASESGRLWFSKMGNPYVAFGMQGGLALFVTSLDGEDLWLTDTDGLLLSPNTLETVSEVKRSDPMLSGPIIDSGAGDMVQIYDALGLLEWIDLDSGERIVVNASKFGDSIALDSIKTVDKNEKHYIILRVNGTGNHCHVLTRWQEDTGVTSLRLDYVAVGGTVDETIDAIGDKSRIADLTGLTVQEE